MPESQRNKGNFVDENNCLQWIEIYNNGLFGFAAIIAGLYSIHK